METRISKNNAAKLKKLEFFKLEDGYQFSVGEKVVLTKSIGDFWDEGDESVIDYVSGEFVDIKDEFFKWGRYKSKKKKGFGGVQRVKSKHLIPGIKYDMMKTLVRLGFVRHEDLQYETFRATPKEAYGRRIYKEFGSDDWRKEGGLLSTF